MLYYLQGTLGIKQWLRVSVGCFFVPGTNQLTDVAAKNGIAN